MSFSTEIKVSDTATGLLVRTQGRIRPAAVAKIAGRTGQNFTRQHYFRLNRARPNELGGKRTNFYAQAARGTSHTTDGAGATISVNQVGIRQRVEGGVILPKNGKFLTIPARAEAHGRRAREFTDLHVRMNRAGTAGALVDAEGGVMFWLVRRVQQNPDPTVMPNLSRMAEAITAQILKAVVRRQGGSAPGGVASGNAPGGDL